VGALGADKILSPGVCYGRRKAIGLACEAVAVSQDPGLTHDASPLRIAGVARNQQCVVQGVCQLGELKVSCELPGWVGQDRSKLGLSCSR
jgi:hypothetical protein